MGPRQQAHQQAKGSHLGSPERAVAEGLGPLLIHLHLVWGSVALTGIAAAVIVLALGRLEHRQLWSVVPLRRSLGGRLLAHFAGHTATVLQPAHGRSSTYALEPHCDRP